MRLGSIEAFPELSEEFGGAVNVAAQLQKDCKELAIGDVVLVAGQAVTIEACLCLTSNNKQTFKVRLGFATLCSLFFFTSGRGSESAIPRCHLSENLAIASTIRIGRAHSFLRQQYNYLCSWYAAVSNRQVIVDVSDTANCVACVLLFYFFV